MGRRAVGTGSPPVRKYGAGGPDARIPCKQGFICFSFERGRRHRISHHVAVQWTTGEQPGESEGVLAAVMVRCSRMKGGGRMDAFDFIFGALGICSFLKFLALLAFNGPQVYGLVCG